MSSYRLDILLMVISTCTFCTGCAIQLGGNGTTGGRESGFCITIMHRATHRLLRSNSMPRKAFLSSPNHRTLRISLRVNFGCSLLWKWASWGRVLQPWRTSNGMRRPNSGGFQKKPSTGASNNGRIDGASVCVRKGPTLKVIRWALSYVLPFQCYTTFPRTFWLPYVQTVNPKFVHCHSVIIGTISQPTAGKGQFPPIRTRLQCIRRCCTEHTSN